jgi:hypothetical protein
MAVRRAERDAERLSGEVHVVGEAALAGQQAFVLEALGGLADTEFHSGISSARQARSPDR